MTEAETDPKVHPVALVRLKAMLDFTEAVARWQVQMLTLPKSKLAGLLKLGTKIIKYLPLGKPHGG